MYTKTLSLFKIITLAIVLTTGLSFAYANWTGPLSSPDTCAPGNAGCDAPINVSAKAQVKKGNLTVGGLQVTGGAPAIGKVLTATDEVGNVTWGVVAGGPDSCNVKQLSQSCEKSPYSCNCGKNGCSTCYLPGIQYQAQFNCPDATFVMSGWSVCM